MPVNMKNLCGHCVIVELRVSGIHFTNGVSHFLYLYPNAVKAVARSNILGNFQRAGFIIFCEGLAMRMFSSRLSRPSPLM